MISSTGRRLANRSGASILRMGASKRPLSRYNKWGYVQTERIVLNGGSSRLDTSFSRLFSTTNTKDTDNNKESEESANNEATEGEGKNAAEAEEEKLTPEEEIEKLREEMVKLREEAEEAKDARLRAYAEMENVRERTKRDIEAATTYANKKFAKSLLDVADNLSRALEAVPEEEREFNTQLANLHEGVSMTEKELLKIFKANGIESFGEAGDQFDPHKHEAMFQMPHDEYESNTVAQVLKKGYTYKDRVLRPAQVGTVQ